MTFSQLSHYAGWSAYVSGVATILGIVTLFVFFSVGEPFGTLNDILSVIIALSMIVILFALYQLHRQAAWGVSLTALVIGVLGMLIAIPFQTLLIFKVITFEQTAVIVPLAFGSFGIALIVYSYLSLVQGPLPARLDILGIIAGAGYVLVITGFILGGEEHPLTTIGGLIIVLCYPAWSIWFGRLLLLDSLTM